MVDRAWCTWSSTPTTSFDREKQNPWHSEEKGGSSWGKSPNCNVNNSETHAGLLQSAFRGSFDETEEGKSVSLCRWLIEMVSSGDTFESSGEMSSLLLKNTEEWSEHTEKLVGIDVGEEINPLGRFNL